jgi:hypothetical protein
VTCREILLQTSAPFYDPEYVYVTVGPVTVYVRCPAGLFIPLGIGVLIVMFASHCLGVDPEIVIKFADVALESVAAVSATPDEEQSDVVPAPPAELCDGVTVIGVELFTDHEIL